MLYQVINSFAVTFAYLDIHSYHKQDQNYLHCCNLDQRKNNLSIQVVKVFGARKRSFTTLSQLSFRDFKIKTISRIYSIGKPEKCSF